MRKLLPATAVAILVSAGLALATPAHADTSRKLPLGRAYQVAADPAAGVVFVAGTANDFIDDGYPGGVVVEAPDGSAPQRIAGTSNATGVTLGPDGLAWATELDGHVVAIDPTTRTVTKTFSTGSLSCPGSIAFAGDTAWFAYGNQNEYCPTSGPAGLASLDTSTGATTDEMQSGQGGSLLASLPGHPDELIATNLTDGGGDLDVLDVADPPVSIVQQRDAVDAVDLVADPVGSSVYVAVGSSVQVYDADDLTSVSTPFDVPSHGATSVAISADGTVLAAAVGDAGSPDLVSTFDTATGARIRTYDTSTPGSANPGQTTLPTQRGLAWLGHTLTAVYEDYGNGYPTLTSLASATRYVSSLSLAAPKQATRARALTVSGVLRSRSAPLAGATLAVRRTDLDGTHRLSSVRTDGQGRYTVHDTPSVGGTVHYVVAYAGDRTHDSVSRSTAVAVSREAPVLTVGLPRSSYRWNQKATITAHLGRTFRNRMVTIYGRPAGYHDELIKRGRVDGHGNLRAVIHLPANSLFSVHFDGDEHFAPRVATARVIVHAVLGVYLPKPLDRSGDTRIYRAGKDTFMNVGVSPLKRGESVRFAYQVYKRSAWHLVGPAVDAALDKNSVTGVRFTGQSGGSYRIRATYYGDRLDAGARTPWEYVRFR